MIKRNERNRMGGARLLAQLGDASARLVNLDPQYRAVLDKLKFGNEGARQKGRAKLPQMSDSDIVLFLEEAMRILKPSGHVLLWADKFTVASGHHLQWLRRVRRLHLVEMITWLKQRPGMGRRARCMTEFLLVLQKEPKRAKGIWRDRGIPDGWPEGADSHLHPHAKPLALTRRLVVALTHPGDLVVDPCAGGYGVLTACQATGREFIGCDLV